MQRVARASVTVDGHVTGAIGRGLLVLLGATHDDGEAQAAWLAGKLAGLRIFPDDEGRMNRDVREAGGAILAVSQFTLAGSIARGRRPSFDNAEEPGRARALFELFLSELAATGIEVRTGRFREMMVVALENDGPVTFVWDG